MALLNVLMASFNLLNGGYGLLISAAVFVVAFIFIVLLASKREIVYIDPDTDFEIAHDKFGWGRKVILSSVNKPGKKFVGWSYDEDGEKRIGKRKIRLWKTTELYAVWEKPIVGIAIEDANAALEFVYINDVTGEELSKEVCPLSIKVPMELDEEPILGWGLDPSQGPLVTASETDKSVLTVELYPVREGWDEVVPEEPIEEEPIEEEPIEEEAPAPVVAVAPVEAPNATVEFVYMNDDNTELNKDVAPFALTVPMEIDGESIVGWAVNTDEPVIKADDESGKVVIQLYPVRKAIEEPVVEEEPAQVEELVVEEEPAAQIEEVASVEPVIVPTYIDANGNELDIRYSRSFTANVIQGEDNVKDFYSELKNHILSYKGVKSRISWKFDSYNRGRDQLFKLKIRGKTICMYCALDPNEFDKARYHHEAVDAKIFEDVPMLVKIKSGLGLKKAKELVDILMAKLGIELDPKAKIVDYVAEHPYEDTPTLIGKGLIKVLNADAFEVVKLTPPTAEEPVFEELFEEVIEEPIPVEETVEEVVVEEAPVEVEPVIVPTYIDGNGNELDIRYSRSFKANVIQADDTVKSYYSELKNHILSYKGVKARTSWKFDSFNKGRVQLVKLKLRGKTISMYCALDPNEFDKAKYHHDETDSKMFEDVPMLVRIKSNLGLKKAKELVDILMAKLEIVADPKASTVDYVAENPYEDTPTLIGKGLIKVLQADENDIKKAPVIQEEPVVEEVVVEEAPVEEVVEEVVEKTVEEVAEEEPVIEEVAEEVAPVEEKEIAPATTVEEIQFVESVSADEVDDLVEDEVLDSLVEEDVEYISKDDTKKAIVNIDTLSKEFNDGDTVDLEALKAKGIVDKKTKSVKILARGILDKALTIKASEFSETAIKMIVLTGGKAVKTVSKVK